MGSLKMMYNALQGTMYAFWGLTIIDILPLFADGILSGFDGAIKTIMALAGLVYFVITIPHKIKMQKLQREKEILEQKLTKEKIEEMEKRNCDE